MKSHMIQCLLALLTLCALKMTAQVVPFTNIQQQVVSGIVQGSTSNNPNFYQWHQLSTTLQGVLIALEPTEVSTLFLEENNCKLQFSNFQLMTFLEASFDNAAFTTLHQGSSRQNVGWIDPSSSFLTLGTHKLKIRFLPNASSILLNREYNIVVVPAPQSMFGDNTQANGSTGNQLTTGNILALYDNPTCSNAEPILLAEGYDASNTTFPEFYRFAGDGLIQRLFDNGYKVYILNFNLANQDLRNNAAVYNSAIRYISSINGNKDVTASGVSMGGVITRYALAKAEADGMPLPVTSFVSIDAPQQGATVDLDFQNSVKSSGQSPAPLLTIASKQLLVAHAWDASRSEHLGFFNELNALNGNGYPKKVPTIGVACSRNVPNPNAGQVWLEIQSKSTGIPLQGKSFTVKNEWAAAGSFLPTASTNIEVIGGSPDWLRYLSLGLPVLTPLWIDLTTTITRNSHPTFIPFTSALDLDAQGVSKFTIRIQQTEINPSFHDQIPLSIGLQLVNVLGVDITTIAANETYNFTALKGRFVRKSIQVNGKMAINKNLPSGSSLMPEAKFNVPLQKLFTSICQPITINVETGGSLDISDNDGSNVFNSILTLKLGDVLRIKNGASLKISKESSIVIGEGAKLIIDAGATINLIDVNSRIIIQNGGELIINGQFNGANGTIGNGHIRFEQGNIFTLNSNLLLRGSARANPLIKIANGATVTVTNPFELKVENGTIYRESGNLASQRHIWLKNGATFFADNVLFDGQSAVLDPATFVEVDDPFDISNDPDDIDYSFVNCDFRNTRLAVKLSVPNVITAIFDWRNINVQFLGCTFVNCQALKAERGYYTYFDNCTLTNSNIDVAQTYWLNVRNTSIRSTYGSGTAIKGTHLGHFWFRETCLIDNWETGIDLTSGLNWNLIMTDGSTIQQCVTGINLNGSVYNNSVDLGILHMDCARMIQNGTAVKGRDIIFSAYARDPNFDTFTKSPNNLNGHYIESIFEHRVESDLWFHGNFWDNTTPSSTPVNASWSFLTQSASQVQIPWNGTFHTDNTRIGDPLNVSNNTNCGGIELRGEKEDPLSKQTIVKVNGVHRDVKVQYDAGFKQLKDKKLKKALDLLVAVAEIPRNVRDTASPVVKHFVDIARAMTLKIGVGTRSSNDGWLPESLVETSREIAENQMIVSPNPANNAVQIELKKGNYTLRVSNTVGQTIFEQNTEGVLSVNVSTWTNGIYLFEVTDKATNKAQRSKIVVQH